jgi:hypothetical protein
MKEHTSSKTLGLTLATTALVGALFAGNASAMADPSRPYPTPLVDEVQKTDETRETGMRFVGWIHVPGAAGATRTVNLEGRLIEGQGLGFTPKQGVRPVHQRSPTDG